MGWQVKMRDDMHKVVVERERHGSTRKSRKWGQRLAFIADADYDDQPKFVSSARRRQYGYNHKWFSDVLGPLRRFLHSNVGRPWDNKNGIFRGTFDGTFSQLPQKFFVCCSLLRSDCFVVHVHHLR
jgi:hypothetical protein